jgi:hypothetical protein
VVVDALYRTEGGGHECLRETVQAVVAGVRNPAHLELSISAVQLLQRCGDRLAAWEEGGHREVAPAGAVANAPGGVDLGGWPIARGESFASSSPAATALTPPPRPYSLHAPLVVFTPQP